MDIITAFRQKEAHYLISLWIITKRTCSLISKIIIIEGSQSARSKYGKSKGYDESQSIKDLNEGAVN